MTCRGRSPFSAAVATLVVSTAAFGQLSMQPPETIFGGDGGPPIAGSEVQAQAGAADGRLWTTMTGDRGLQLSRDGVPGQDGVEYIGFMSSFVTARIEVGFVPVRLHDFDFTYNGKLVNGGGTMTLPTTRHVFGFGIKELDSSGVYDIIAYDHELPLLEGNGYRVSDVEFALHDLEYVLGAGRLYEISMYSLITIEAAGFDPQVTPGITVTEEFGGPYSGGAYQGLQLAVSYEPVPAPCTAGVMFIAAAVGTRRRR